MIYLYSGTPGSGKSMHSCMDVWDCLNRRKPIPVIANFDVRHDLRNYDEAYHYISNKNLHPEDLVLFARDWWESHRFREDSLVLIVDEAQLLFNSREWNNPDRMAWLQFLSQHRHYGYKVILIAQSDRMIDRQFRALLEYNVVHRKLSNFGIGGFILSMVCLGRLFVAVTTYYGLKERTGVRFFVARKKWANMYDSYAEFERLEAKRPKALGKSERQKG